MEFWPPLSPLCITLSYFNWKMAKIVLGVPLSEMVINVMDIDNLVSINHRKLLKAEKGHWKVKKGHYYNAYQHDCKKYNFFHPNSSIWFAAWRK